MNKTEYMNALRQALEGLPAEVIEETMWTYERKFIDAMVSGSSEEEIAASLPKPSLVAVQKKTGVRYAEVKKDFSLGNIASLFISLIGLLVFNLFMIIPATVYFCLLFAAYVCSLAFYGVGIGITAASLSGVPQFNFDIPAHGRVIVAGAETHRHYHHGGNVRVDISPAGVIVDDDTDASDSADDESGSGTTVTIVSTPATAKPAAAVAASVSSLPAAASATAVAATAASTTAAASPTAAASAADDTKVHVNVGNHVRFHHIWEGLGLLFGGIVLFLFCLSMTRYTFIGFRNYLSWNVSLLKLPAAARISAA